jgi:hypothetical protein
MNFVTPGGVVNPDGSEKETCLAAQESQWARRHLLLTEKNHVLDSFRQGVLEQEIYEKLLADIDARLLRLESGEEEKTAIGSDPGKIKE